MPAFSLNMLRSPAAMRPHAVELPEVGEGVVAYIAELTAHERDMRIESQWHKHMESTGDSGMVGFRSLVVAACLCDESRRFLCNTIADVRDAIASLGGAQSRIVAKLFVKAAEVNGLLAGEDAEKN